MSNAQIAGALRLHRYLSAANMRDGALVGADPGVRLNYRVFRFVKSYAAALPWRDDLYYVQGQGYWILANWRLFERTGEDAYRDAAIACSQKLIEQQRRDGAWDYPNPEWRGRVATAEGTWGAIGLLETYRQTRDGNVLESVLKWFQFVETRIGFQHVGDTLAVNYFADQVAERVPNNTAFYLRFLAELDAATGFVTDADGRRQLLNFMSEAQMPSGEIPYEMDGGMAHFQCYQYNAFQAIDLLRFYELTGDAAARAIAERVLAFLAGGVCEDGHVAYGCDSSKRAVTYHAAVGAAAFRYAGALGIAGYDTLAARAYRYVLNRQRRDGSFPHSYGDYGVLSDRRSYPRYLAMILYHLLQPDSNERGSHAHWRNRVDEARA